MNTNRSMAWLREAVGGIKYPPDRRKVEKELYTHIMQRNRDFLEAGCTERDADEKACEAMGDPVEVRRDLAANHRPFWGYAAFILRILVIGVFLWALISALRSSPRIVYALGPLVDENRFTVSGEWRSQDSRIRCGDYTIRLKQTAYGKEKETGESCLLLELRTFTADPFLDPLWFVYQPVLEDSRGLVYPVEQSNSRNLVFTGRRLLFVYLQPGADWAVLTIQGPDGPERLTIRLEEGRA